MPWIQAHLIVPKEQSSLIEWLFESIGAVSITFGDAQDEPVLETLPDEMRLWSLVKVSALFEFNDHINDEIRQKINQALHQDISQQLTLEILHDQEWERTWLKYFKPIKFGQRLWICPSGHQISETNAIVIDLDPGLAFGTGTHPTTALCLEWLEQAHLNDKHVIDYGCGSGILAIAALKLGASHATGIDYDPQALIASLDNAKKNQVSHALTTLDTHTPPDQKADILVANILAGVLIELAPIIHQQVKPHGQIILSGILPEQAESVNNTYKQWFKMKPITESNGWVRLEGTQFT